MSTPQMSLGPGTLTEQEREALALFLGGRQDREIAARLSCSEAAVAEHLESASRKLGVSDRLELLIRRYYYGRTQSACRPEATEGFPVPDGRSRARGRQYI